MSKTSRPLIIGIPGWKTGENSFGAGVHHLEYIRQFGIPRIIFPEETETGIDVLYLPGGPDLSPSSYKQVPSLYTSNADLHKQYFYDHCLQKYIDNGTPIFGVCLGFQMLAVKFGSRLTQELGPHPQSKNRGEEAHDITTPLGLKFKVNSHHHQGIFFDDLGKDLRVEALYKETKSDPNPLVEAIRHSVLPIYGVQWHPEEYYSPFADELFSKACSRSTQRINERA